MAVAPRLIAAVLAVAAAPAGAAADPSCAPAGSAYGLTLVAHAGGVEVAAAASPGARVAAGDVVLQANGERVARCADVERAIAAAARDGAALLLLLRRGGERIVVALDAAAPALVAAAPPPATAPPAAAPPPPQAASTPAPPPHEPPAAWRPAAIPARRSATADEVLAALGALGARAREGLEPYRRAVREASGLVAALPRDAATPERRAALEGVLTDHAAAVVAWEAMDALREELGLRRRTPISESISAPYFAGSATAAMLAELPLLAPAVAAHPEGTLVERAGRWYPAQARRLLWERAGARSGRLLAETAGP